MNQNNHAQLKKLPVETKLVPPLKAIRQHCIDCSGFELKEVRLCTFIDCDLFPFRFGSNPQYSNRAKALVFEETKH